jgi:predicted membrane protein
MVFFNANTVFGLAAAMCGALSAYALFRNGTAAVFGGALGAMVVDIIMRLRDDNNEVPLLAPDAGGHIWFIPLWLWAAVSTIIGFVAWLGWI